MYKQSRKLANVCYDIRGPVLVQAKKLEDEGNKILKLNIGNPAPFGFEAPDEILKDMILNLPKSQGYCESKGLFTARKAIMQYYQEFGIKNIDTNDIYLGNGVSELIVMVNQALLDNDDEVLVPAPDYPLWTASVSLAGGKPVHYLCDENNGWFPSIDDIKQNITAKTRAIVVINPNNPTGAVYSKEILLQIIEIAKQHNLIIFSDEIYDKILYDNAVHYPIASLTSDVLCITFNGLSKTYRVAGFRSGWMMITGPKHLAKNYIAGLDILSNMRLCANVPAQQAIQTALGGYQSIKDLILPGGRLKEQRDVAYNAILSSKNLETVKPSGALYMFVKIKKPIQDDEKFALDLLNKEKILIVQGTAFNYPNTNYFRIVTLPWREQLLEAISKIDNFLNSYEQ